MNKEDVVNSFLEKGFLLSPDFFEVGDFDNKEFLRLAAMKLKAKEKPVILNKDLFFVIKENNTNLDINWLEFEKSKALSEKGKNGKIYHTFLDILNYNVSEEKREVLNGILKGIEEPEKKIVLEKPKTQEPSVMILKSYKEDAKKREIEDFVSYFKSRYEALKKTLQGRAELQNLVSINRVISKGSREPVSLMGFVYEKYTTRNGNILLTLEDPTGQISVLVNKNKPELFDLAKDLVEDEIIGVNGVCGNRIVFANNIIYPDISISEPKKAPEDVYAAFTADLHIGNKMFLADDFARFVKWLDGKIGSIKQRRVARRVKYLFIVGDLVDGVGVYPEQDKELAIKDIYKQYELCAKLLSEIREDIKIIICPGNHDALRISVPQPVLDKEFAKSLWKLRNVTMVSNPAIVNIHSSEDFSGFDVLLYHGYSFHYYIDNVESLRLNNARDNPNLVSKFLLQRRHLAPSHSSALYIPVTEEDPLVIEKIPDLFVTGEMHRSDVSNYNNVITINCSCWQAKTDYQEKTGNHPDPSKVPILNLRTRQMKMLKFGK